MDNILDEHNRAIAQILTRFRNMVIAATEQLPASGAVIEHASLNRMTMETESNALVRTFLSLIPLKVIVCICLANMGTPLQRLIDLLALSYPYQYRHSSTHCSLYPGP
jgi:hypothetical protein